MENSYNELSEEQEIAYRLYKTNGDFEDSWTFAETLNSMLRSGSVKSSWQQWVDILDSVANLNKLTSGMTVFRATSHTFVEKQTDSGIIMDPAFLSTAIQKDAILRHYPDTKEYPPAVLCIFCPEGTCAMPMDQMPGSSQSELEFLLPRNSKLMITSTRIITDQAELQQFFGIRWALHHNDVYKLVQYDTELLLD